MKICKEIREEEEIETLPLIDRHLYMHINPGELCHKNIYIYIEKVNTLFNLEYSRQWNLNDGWGDTEFRDKKYWKDITDEYCLKRIVEE